MLFKAHWDVPKPAVTQLDSQPHAGTASQRREGPRAPELPLQQGSVCTETAPKPGVSQRLDPLNRAAEPDGPALTHCLSLSCSCPQLGRWEPGVGDKTPALPWKWGLGESHARGPVPTPVGKRASGQRLSPQLGDHRGMGSTALLPPSLTQAPALPSPCNNKLEPHFHLSEGQPWRVQQDPRPPSAGTRVVPGSHLEGANPLTPKSPLPVGSKARTRCSQIPMARQQERRHRPRSRPLHPRREHGDPLGSREEPPARGRALPAAAAHSCSPPALVSCLMSKL